MKKIDLAKTSGNSPPKEKSLDNTDKEYNKDILIFENQELLTANELAKILKVSPKTIYGWVYRGEIPVRKVGQRLIRFERDEINRWIFQKTGDST